MVSVGVRGMGDAFPMDQERDANSQLLELDKGLRSGKVGEQCEAIVRFPQLFEKYPFPIVINSAFVKLADVFKGGTNILRLCVQKVVQQSDKHLDKIINVDEFIQRVFYVIHSNDPVARAITLRTLGSLARIIPERKNVHHSIFYGLESHDSVELEAAIFAAPLYAAQSKSFAVGIFSHLTSMIEGLETPVEVKLKLIPIFQHMHHDPFTAQKVRELCTNLLPSYPGRRFVLTTLHTLSLLASKSLLDIPQQVSLLLDYLKTDCRRAVKTLTLRDLKLLAQKGPHMWTEDNITVLCEYILTVSEISFRSQQMAALQVLMTLSSSVAVKQFPKSTDGAVMRCITGCCYHDDVNIAALGVRVFSDVAIYANNGSTDPGPLLEAASLAIESLIVIVTGFHGAASKTPAAQPEKIDSHSPTKKVAVVDGNSPFRSGYQLSYFSCNKALDVAMPLDCLRCVIRVCNACPALADSFVDTIITAINTVTGYDAVLLCDCLSALSSVQSGLLMNIVPDVLTILEKQLRSRELQPQSEKLIVALTTLLFQSCIDEDLPDSVLSCIRQVMGQVNCWSCYTIGRQAARYGHHVLAEQIFSGLTTKISTENFYFWLSGLRDCCEAECYLYGSSPESVPVFIKTLSQATSAYQKACSALKAATLPGFQLDFQVEYVRLRIKLLRLFSEVIKASCSLQTCPPPAIATTLTTSTGQEYHKYGHFLQQLKPLCDEFKALSTGYGKLYQASFDADVVSLKNIQLLQQSCMVVLHVINSVVAGTVSANKSLKWQSTAPVSLPTEEVPLEHQPLQMALQDSLEQVKVTVQQNDQQTITHEHTDCLVKVLMRICTVPLPFPRFFFQRLQSTQLKLAISPQPRTPVDPVTVHYDTLLTLKVEGVVQHGGQKGLLRKVAAVKLNVTSVLNSRGQMVADSSKLQESVPNDLSKVAEPHNDYFSAQFLLSFGIAGTHTVTVEAMSVDEDGAEWFTGPTHTLNIKSYDEGVQRQQQQQYAAQRQQQRAALVASISYQNV